MYGPPPDPRQLLAPVQLIDDPLSHLACVAIGAALTLLAWRWKRPGPHIRAALFILGQTIWLTMPLAAHLDTYVYGSFPTIDKEGSLLFYLDGVHRRLLAHPVASAADPAVRLIGIHVGHLWVTELFDLFLSPMGAFNLQGLLYPPLAWYAAWLLLRDVCRDDRIALLLGFPFGMGLHLFRDLNWYTIEKAAVFWLALFAWALHRAWRDGGPWRELTGVIYLLMSWMNLYLGLVGAALGGLAMLGAGWPSLRSRTLLPQTRWVARAMWACAAGGVPLAIWQLALLNGGPGLGSPDRFLWERAALDGFSLFPLRWNRLEIHRALNLIAVGLALVGVVRRWKDGRVRWALAAGLFLAALSVGPVLLPGPVENPLYMAVRAVVPGFWRVAKPEVFFHGTWLLMLCVAAIELSRVSRKGLGWLYALFVVGWVIMVRTHPAYPPMTMPVESSLSPDWAEKVFVE